MPAIVTNKNRIFVSDSFTKSLVDIPLYAFFGRTSPWEDEPTPEDVDDTTLAIIDAVQEIIGFKRIQQNDVVSVVKRIDWSTGTIYDEYRDDVNQIDGVSDITGDFFEFYVLTDEFNVYKCISNNNRVASTNKPTGTSINTFQTPDGYIWKYMYTINTNDAFRYLTPNWMPIFTLAFNDGSAQWAVQDSAVSGTIDHVYLTNNGANYTEANLPVVTVSGDGTGAEAIAVVDDVTGTVTNIIVTNKGQGYTNATVTITGGDGVGAVAVAVISPIGGHGSDARAELGATFKMIRVVLNGDESGLIPLDVNYRRTGLINSPLTTITGVRLSVDDTSLYQIGETVTGATSLASGTLTSVDRIKNYLYLSTVTGSFTNGENVSSQSYNSTELYQAIVDFNLPMADSVVSIDDYEENTGDVLYVANRELVSRGTNQNEEIRFVISF